jgi:hypothetical protein
MIRVARDAVAPFAVGASEVGAVLGCDPWTTPLALFRRKRGLDPAPEDRPAMRAGRVLEGPVVQLARDVIPLPIRRNRVTFAHPSLPLFATPDGFVGRDRLLEAKVVGFRRLDAWDDGVPCHVRAQVQAQLLVTGRDAGYVVALVGTELRVTLVERDVQYQATIADSVEAFVDRHVATGIPPDPLTFDERWADLVDDVDGLPPLDVLAGEEIQLAGDRIVDIRGEVRELEDETDALRLLVLSAMADAGTSRLIGNGWTATASERRGSPSWRDVATELAGDVDPVAFAGVVARHTPPATTTFVVRASRGRTDV